MKGVVEVYRGEEKILEESNMTMDNTGELIVDMLTMLREISGIPTASAILDTSNYTVRAASLGKDALGYQHHAHSDLVYTSEDAIIRVLSYEDVTVCSYHTSAFASATNVAILPQASHPKMNRLEDASTAIDGLHNYGHNINQITTNKKFGCFAPSGAFEVYIVSAALVEGSESENVIVSGSFNNRDGFNAFANPSAIDSRGFIVNTVSSMIQGKSLEDAEEYRGLLLSYDDLWSDDTLHVRYVLGIRPEDFIVLNAYGGVYNIGLWGIDLKKMLAKGMLPPYTLSASDDMEYRLLARKSFNRDLTYYSDDVDLPGLTNVKIPLRFVWRWVFK